MVRGLTTFINKKSHIYMEKYELHDTQLILDGGSLSHSLFGTHFNPKNCCFNGDYDRYANLVRSFLSTLLDCNVTPYIFYDGGYEDKRLKKNLSRMQDRINTAAILNPASEEIIFPLCLGETFKDVAEELNIKVICCNYESDLEAAGLANNLNCPVMSYDSDFYIFDVLYIPFNTVKLRPITCLKTKGNEKHVYKYLACQRFNKEKFLQDINLEHDKLAIFAVLLGNDYIHREVFNNLYKKIKSHKISNPIAIIASFLSNKKQETVIQELLTICNLKEESAIVDKIYSSIKNYTINKENSKYLRYLTPANVCGSEKVIVKKEINIFVKDTGAPPEMLALFINNFRRCMYPSYFITILFSDVYHVRPQVEDISMTSAHLVNMDIISSIHKILKPSSGELQFHTRIGLEHKKHLIPPCPIAVPSYIDIKNMDINSRQQILLKVLGCDKKFNDNCLNLFPGSWKIYIIAIKYICNKSHITWSFVYSLLLCKIVIKYVYTNIKEVVHDPELFFDTFKEDIFRILKNKDVIPNLKHTIQDSINNITYEDSLLALNILINFFQVKSEIIQNTDLFDRSLVHSIAEFQSCLYHIKSLNSLLDLPFQNCTMMSCFNGTFLYNITDELRQQSTDYYIQDFLKESPAILNCLNLMIENLKEHIDIIF